MAKMGSRKHLKRYKAPKSWPIHPKEDTWTVKPAPGSHAIEDSLPLLVIIRDILEYIGAIIDKSTEPNRIYSNLLYESERIKVLIDKLRQIRETVTQINKNKNEEL